MDVEYADSVFLFRVEATDLGDVRLESGDNLVSVGRQGGVEVC